MQWHCTPSVGHAVHGITRIECAYSAEEALKLLEIRDFNVLFADIHMDGMDGLTLIERAKEKRPDLICVVVTAYDAFSYAQRALRLGVEDFLVKPCSERMMKELVQKIIVRFKARQKATLENLDLRLGGMLVEGAQGDIGACFLKAGLSYPGNALRMAVWRDNAKLRAPQPPPSVFAYQPYGHHYLLCACAQEDKDALWNWLEQVSAAFSQCLGVSMPGGTMREMLLSARTALQLDWCCTVPRPIADKQSERIEQSPTVQTLLLKIRTLSISEVREALYALASSIEENQPARLDALVRLCWVNLANFCRDVQIECPKAALKPGMGFDAAAENLLAAMAIVRRALSDTAQEQPLAFARRYVAEHLTQTVDMAVLANRLNMSYTYFSRWFREKTGLSFSEYVLEMRMQEACRMLIMGERITTVAQRLGYQNTNNFTRTFTKLYGVSPRQWRRDQLPDRQRDDDA